MADVGTLDLLGEIQALVSDKLQVVSYKWLSRNFSVSSNDAKRILQEFVEQNGSGLEIVYTLAGQLKKSAPSYHIQLVSGVKLEEVKKQFEDDCSIQVYSVQACIPKDPAAIWNSELIQAEELFYQPSSVDNCLKDNRFCGVKNSFVKRNVNGASTNVARSKSSPHTPIVPEQKVKKIETPSVKTVPSPVVAVPVVKTECKVSDISPNPNANVGKVAALPAKKKVQNVKSPSGTGGSLANMWGRASVKPKPTSPTEANEDAPIPIANLATADAQICALEEIENLSDDDMGVNYKRNSNGEGKRKRQVVFDDSDEDEFEDAVNLASPDPPKNQATPKSEPLLLEKNTLNFEEPIEESPKKKEKIIEKVSKVEPKEEKVIASKDKNPGKSVKSPVLENNANRKDKITENASSKPTRRKVLKTRIDERGREVTEVVWEGEETENKETVKKETVVSETTNNRPPPPPPVAAKKSPAVASNVEPPAAAKKSPAVASNVGSNPVGKGGPKKAGKAVVKDAKQGNIMSFFKKA